MKKPSEKTSPDKENKKVNAEKGIEDYVNNYLVKKEYY